MAVIQYGSLRFRQLAPLLHFASRTSYPSHQSEPLCIALDHKI
jgi:hypothetical protein